MKEKGLIIGKGWLGKRLEHFLYDEYDFITTKRSSDELNCISINFNNQSTIKINTNDFQFIIITIPFGRRHSIEELDNKFNNLIKFIENFNKQIILISSTAIYPDSNQIVDEYTYNKSSLNSIYTHIEDKITKTFPQTVILRLGGLMGDNRILSRYISLNKENLDTVVNQIHYLDVCKSIKTILEKNIQQEIYNVVAPFHPTKEEILQLQINQKIIHSTSKKGKIISSQKLIEDLEFEFSFKNPLFF